MINPDSKHIIALTEGAGFCSFVVSLMALHFIVPGSILFLIWLLPAVFGLIFNRLPIRIYCLTILTTFLGVIIVFGITTGLWSLFYTAYGGINAYCIRNRFWSPIQLCLSTLCFLGFFGVLLVALAYLADISLEQLEESLRPMVDLIKNSFEISSGQSILIIIGAMLGLGFINSLITNQIIKYLSLMLD